MIDKIAIWVHPLWSNNDLGDELIEFWQRNINTFAEDPRFAFVLTGCPKNSCDCKTWGERLYPLIDSLPELFAERYMRWPENFIEGLNPEHINLLCKQFRLPEMEYSQNQIPIKKLFREARVDGLVPGPDYCVGNQVREIKTLCEPFSVRYWKAD